MPIKSFSQKPAFSNFAGNGYDPRFTGNTYDPRFANSANGSADAPGTLTQGAKAGQKMQINLGLNNATAGTKVVELWYYLNSMTRVLNPAYSTGNYSYIPQTSYEGIKAIAAATNQTVGFDSVGNLIIRGLLADPVVTVSCKEIAYTSFFEASFVTPFYVAWFRQTVTTDPQFDESIDWIKKTFAGGQMSNPINPRAFFDPDQQQNLTVDVMSSFDIAADRGIRMNVLTGNNVRLALFIQEWTNQVIGQ